MIALFYATKFNIVCYIAIENQSRLLCSKTKAIPKMCKNRRKRKIIKVLNKKLAN